MIEVEISGPIAKKDYEKVKKLLIGAGEGVHTETQVELSYSDKGYNNREVKIENKDGARICINTGKMGERKSKITALADNAFSDGVEMLAELGYRKGIVLAHDVFLCSYGGAEFTLFEPFDESYHYHASIFSKNPTEAKEAKQKLEKLSRNLKLPIWTRNDMLTFLEQLNKKERYVYDYEKDGQNYFKEKFGI